MINWFKIWFGCRQLTHRAISNIQTHLNSCIHSASQQTKWLIVVSDDGRITHKSLSSDYSAFHQLMTNNNSTWLLFAGTYSVKQSSVELKHDISCLHQVEVLQHTNIITSTQPTWLQNGKTAPVVTVSLLVNNIPLNITHWVTLTFDLAFCSAIRWAKP